MLSKSKSEREKAPLSGFLAPEVKIKCFACGVREVVCNVFMLLLLIAPFLAFAVSGFRPPAKPQPIKEIDSLWIATHSSGVTVKSLVLSWGPPPSVGRKRQKHCLGGCKVLINLKLGARSLPIYLVVFQAPSGFLPLPVLIVPRRSKLV